MKLKGKNTVIYVGGTFDCFHSGHVNLLKKAKQIANYVVVALNSDGFSTRFKRKPLLTELERFEVINSCKYVDLVFIVESGDEQKKYMEIIKPDFILHGDDWTGDSLIKQLGIDKRFLKNNDIELKYVPYTKGISSSDILNRIKQNGL